MDDRAGSFVAVRRISQSLDRGSTNTCHSSSAEAVAGSAAWLGRGLSCVCAQRRDSDARPSFDLTPTQVYVHETYIKRYQLQNLKFHCILEICALCIKSVLDALSLVLSLYRISQCYSVLGNTGKEEECLQRLQSRIDVVYDSSIPEHQEALKSLWHHAFPEEELHGLISEQWKEMGWQGKDPSTDFRGGGFISLENLLFFAKNFSKSFQDLLLKREGERSVWEYPFAVAGVNITFMLIQMLELEAVKPRTLVGANFLKFLTENELAFDLLYCITFKLMDHQWLNMHASYMDFNTVMKSTRRQLERELLFEDITRLEELPSYSLLSR